MMDMTDLIDEYVEGKGVSEGTAKTQKSILMTFNKWAVGRAVTEPVLLGKFYAEHLSKREGLKPKTLRTHVGLVTAFCRWLDDRGKVEPPDLLAPTTQRPATPRELERICRAALVQGDKGKRNASMALLMITCGLTAEEIACLTHFDVSTPFHDEGSIRRGGRRVPMPDIATDMMWLYKGTGCRPSHNYVFCRPSDPDLPMRPSDVKRCIGDILDRAGVDRAVLAQGGAESTLATHLDRLSGKASKAVCTYVKSLCYDGVKFPDGLLRKEVAEMADKSRSECCSVSRLSL